MKFAYRSYEVQPTPGHPHVRELHRPVVPLRVVGATGDAVVMALVDTGADVTILPAFLIHQLGVPIDERKRSRFRGVGTQTVSVIYGTVELVLEKGRSKYRWPTAVAFLEGQTVAILGHTGCLQYFRVTFDGERRELTLQATSALPK